MDIKIMRVAMLCAQRGIRAYTRVENGIQTTALGIFPAEPEHYRGSLRDWLKVEPTPVPARLEQNIRAFCDLDQLAWMFNWAGFYSTDEYQLVTAGAPRAELSASESYYPD